MDFYGFCASFFSIPIFNFQASLKKMTKNECSGVLSSVQRRKKIALVNFFFFENVKFLDFSFISLAVVANCKKHLFAFVQSFSNFQASLKKTDKFKRSGIFSCI